ncbi:MAG: aspartate--tRNA(Asn) ligase [Candidatus Hadarchaeales archaeon]
MDELEDLRRTHLAGEITEKNEGQEVILMGFVENIRDLGGIKFFILRDISGTIQITIPKQKASQKILQKISILTPESCVAVRGAVVRVPQAPRGIEVIPSEIRILNLAQTPLPLDITGRVKANLDTRLDARALDLRRREVLAIFKIRHTAVQAIRECLASLGFVEVHTPKIVATATESGAALFPLTYFDREAFLSQSPQLYKEVLTGAFERVFEIGPIFRAEEHDTPRHLNEATSVDIEMAYARAEDVMKILEEVIISVFSRVNEKCRQELDILNKTLEVPEKPFPRLTYSEVLQKLDEAGLHIPWGEDIPTPAEKKLGEMFPGPYFIIDWPLKIKPFYTMPKSENRELAEAFDLMYGSLELASGGTRIHQYDLLVERLKDHGLNPENFSYHLLPFKYGMPPHAGWGLGLERLTMVLTGAENIRECALFPRDKKRLTP